MNNHAPTSVSKVPVEGQTSLTPLVDSTAVQYTNTIVDVVRVILMGSTSPISLATGGAYRRAPPSKHAVGTILLTYVVAPTQRSPEP